MKKKTENSIETGMRRAQQLRDNGWVTIDEQTGIRNAQKLLERSEIATVGSIDPKGFPNTKVMFIRKSAGLDNVWLGTYLSSNRVAQFMQNPKASLYFFDINSGEGLLLIGKMDVLRDTQSKQELWRTGWEVYYPLGAVDPNYGILKFTAQSGNYYKELQSIEFEL